MATGSPINYSPIVQRINKTCLKPDIGCFVLFDGGFSGLVVMNFTAAAAMDIYRAYMQSMGLPADSLAVQHTSDEVGDTLGELMNQIMGRYQATVEQELQISLNQSQPKMLVVNKELVLSVNAKLEKPQSRKVMFTTANHRPFYVEMSIEKTEFVELFPTEKQPAVDVDQIVEHGGDPSRPSAPPPPAATHADDDLISQLGL